MTQEGQRKACNATMLEKVQFRIPDGANNALLAYDVINKSNYSILPKKIGSHASYECLKKCRNKRTSQSHHTSCKVPWYKEEKHRSLLLYICYIYTHNFIGFSNVKRRQMWWYKTRLYLHLAPKNATHFLQPFLFLFEQYGRNMYCTLTTAEGLSVLIINMLRICVYFAI